MKKEKMERIFSYLDELYPDARCELNHSNPLELLVATLLSAQTTDASVNKITPALFERCKSAQDYIDISSSELEGYIRPIGLQKMKAKNIMLMCEALVARFNGEVPADFDEMVALPGVGRKTASVVISDAFGIPAFAVDTHVTRISKRLGFCFKKDTVAAIEKKLMKNVPKDRWIRSHHQMVLFGRYFCKAQKPNCSQCKLCDICKETNKNL